LPDGGYNLRT